MPHRKLITKILQRYWRFSRGLSLEVRACAQDASGRVLLVRKSPAAPWRLPGGTVARGETAAMAVKRWLLTEGQLEVTADPRLYAVNAGKPPAQSDQIALYLVLSWKEAKGASHAAATRSFFAPGRLPQDIDPSSLAWLNDANEARVTLQVW